MAGIAHELNNPVAAIQRSVDFIAEDMITLAARLPDGETVKSVLQAAGHDGADLDRRTPQARGPP